MKKLFKVIILSLLMVCFISFNMQFYIYADTAPRFAGELIGGVGYEETRYWYYEGSSTYFYSCAKQAFKSWMDESVNPVANLIVFNNTTYKNKACITIKVSFDGPGIGYNGKTEFFNRGQQISPYSFESWDNVVISYNASNGIIDNSKSYQVIETLCHEIGHAFGLTENNMNPNSIMCQYHMGRNVVVPTHNDIWSTVAIYYK